MSEEASKVWMELNQKYLRGLFDESIMQLLDRVQIDSLRMNYRQKCDQIEKEIRIMEANMLENQTAKTILGWIDQYRPFFSFQEITRPMLAYLVRRITVDDNKEVCVEFLHEREFELECD